jgi:uncharacterized protein YxeA
MKRMILLLGVVIVTISTSVYAADKVAEISKNSPIVSPYNKAKSEAKAQAPKSHSKKKIKMRGIRG